MSVALSFTLQISTQCAACHGPMHLAGFAERHTCPSCQRELNTNLTQWSEWYEPELIAEAMGLERGQARQLTSMGRVNTTYLLGSRPPRCQECKTDTPMDRLSEYAEQGGYTCTCGEHIAVRAAPPLAREIFPGARWLVNEGPLTDRSDTATQPVVISCSACAGSLPVDGSSRAVRCTFCSASNYLPDGLWRRLHPPHTVRVFFLVADLSVEEKLALRAAGDPRAAAGAPDLPAALAEKLARDKDSDVRAELAQNPRCPPQILSSLAKRLFRPRGACRKSRPPGERPDALARPRDRLRRAPGRDPAPRPARGGAPALGQRR